ncbi:MAG TPA: D-arabinono-1,4-lactone oxidase [Silvibacterium sp.]|nr:D-arabinono-1,4-lactone oxidase [Silvibacterium sp.]
MDKREFLKTSGVILTGSLLQRYVSAEEQAQHRTNWAGNYEYHAKNLLSPKTTEEVQTAVKGCATLKALGARHSFNGIADNPENQISLKQLDSMTLDEQARTVTVGAGVTYGKLAPYIDAKGYALHNLASLPHISVVGACSTATHGSGNRNGNLSTAVSGFEWVAADGEVKTISRLQDGERFRGAVVGLGGLGVITKITLDVQPTYQISQAVYEDLSVTQLEKNLEEIFASGYSVSLFTDWQNHRMTQVWIKRRVEPGSAMKWAPEFFGAKLATKKLHPIAGHSAESCTEQGGVPGPWYERLPHFKMNFTPSSGAELQTEYFVPRDKGYEAILAVEELRDQITPHLFVTELRTIEADDLWMSMAYKRPSMAIHFTWKPEWPAVKTILPQIEEKLTRFDARPHWAKLFSVPPARLRHLYPKMADFQALLTEYDPKGKFRNDFLNANIFA